MEYQFKGLIHSSGWKDREVPAEFRQTNSFPLWEEKAATELRHQEPWLYKIALHAYMAFLVMYFKYCPI